MIFGNLRQSCDFRGVPKCSGYIPRSLEETGWSSEVLGKYQVTFSYLRKASGKLRSLTSVITSGFVLPLDIFVAICTHFWPIRIKYFSNGLPASQVGYCFGKPIERVAYCFNGITMEKVSYK